MRAYAISLEKIAFEFLVASWRRGDKKISLPSFLFEY